VEGPTAQRVTIYDACRAVGGAHTSLASLIPELLEAGHEVDVVVTCADAREAILRRLPSGARGRVTVDVMPDRFGAATRGVGYAVRELRRAAWLLVRARRRGAPTRWINDNGPQINAAGALVARALGVPLAQYVRGAFYRGRLAGWLVGLADVAWTVGAQAKACVEEVSPGTPVMEVVEALGAQAPTPRAPDARGVLWASSLVRWKGAGLALEAYARAEADAPMRLCYLSAPMAEDAEALPEVLPEGARAYHDPPDLDAIRASCHVYVHTSLRPEPFGRAVLEAMAAGLCPVVPDDMSTALVDHGHTGLVYRAGDADDLTRTLRRALGDPEHTLRLGEAAARRARAMEEGGAFAPVVAWVGDPRATPGSHALTRASISQRVVGLAPHDS
jgi:glycosyltransferase involved in cell wall biosynthesis